jgi:hypothetical protein
VNLDQIRAAIESRDDTEKLLKQQDRELRQIAFDYAREHNMSFFFVEHLRRAVTHEVRA